jgi:predicted ester cyclase
MKKWQRAAVAATLAGAAVAGTAIAANASPSHTRSAVAAPGRPGSVAANIRVVETFVQDVLNEHHGDHAGLYMTADVEWHGGTVGTIEGRENVAGLFAGVVSSLPNVHAALEDAFGQGDEVVVRMVVSGTQTGPVLGIPATGRNIHWDAIDIFRLNGGKISAIWAGDDWSAVLYYTGTYTAPGSTDPSLHIHDRTTAVKG